MISRCRRAVSALIVCLSLTVLSANVHAAQGTTETVSALEKLAEQKFGTLSRAEQLVVRGAPMRNLVYLGPNNDPVSPENRAVDGDKWGPDRTVRADLVRWLAADPAAIPYVHPSGIGFAGGRIAGQIDLSYLQVPKPITMLACYIPDGLDLSHSHLRAIDLRRSSTGPVGGDYSNIGGEVSMLQGHYGPVSFFRAQISGSLDFIGAHVSNPGDEAIVATEATIGGDADFHQGFTTDGIVDFRLAKVGHSLSFNDAHFEGAGQNGLDAERAAISGMFYWVSISHTPRTILDLANAQAQGIGDDVSSWPAAGNLNVDGFEYGSIVDGPSDAEARLQWLALQPPGYRPQPFQQLAKVLTAVGNDEGATTVLIARRVAQRRYGNLKFPDRVWNLVLEYTIGYGYRPLRALWWILAFVTIGAGLFEVGYLLKIVTPTEAEAYYTYLETGDVPGYYQPFHAFVYSLENFLPVVELHQGDYWRPNPLHGPAKTPEEHLQRPPHRLMARLLRWYLWLHILAGWSLTPLLFAGLSGLIRPD